MNLSTLPVVRHNTTLPLSCQLCLLRRIASYCVIPTLNMLHETLDCVARTLAGPALPHLRPTMVPLTPPFYTLFKPCTPSFLPPPAPLAPVALDY
jgi:hypothetical protein